MLLLLMILFLIIGKMQLYPLLKQSYKKEVAVYVVCYAVAAALLVMVSRDAARISFFQ